MKKHTRFGIVKKMVAAAAVCILVPSLFTFIATGVIEPSVRADIGRAGRVRISSGKSYIDVGTEDYIAGVLATRLWYGEETELVKAQAVMLRTQIYRAMGGEMSVDADELAMTYLSKNNRRKLWQSEYEEKENLIEDCVAAVSGQVMRREGELVSDDRDICASYTDSADGYVLSFNYAQSMARDGVSCEEILKYFYGQITIESV